MSGTRTQRNWLKGKGFIAMVCKEIGGIMSTDFQEGKKGNGGGQSVAGPEKGRAEAEARRQVDKQARTQSGMQ